MANLPRLVLKAYEELSLEPRQYVTRRAQKNILDGLVDICNLVFYFF